MSEQQLLSPDQVSTNEITLICVKLLGLHWKYIAHAGLCAWANDKGEVFSINRFDTWAEAGLILAALDERNLDVEIGNGIKDGVVSGWYCRLTGWRLNDSPFCKEAPAAIRSAALKHIRSLP